MSKPDLKYTSVFSTYFLFKYPQHKSIYHYLYQVLTATKGKLRNFVLNR